MKRILFFAALMLMACALWSPAAIGQTTKEIYSDTLTSGENDTTSTYDVGHLESLSLEMYMTNDTTVADSAKSFRAAIQVLDRDGNVVCPNGGDSLLYIFNNKFPGNKETWYSWDLADSIIATAYEIRIILLDDSTRVSSYRTIVTVKLTGLKKDNVTGFSWENQEDDAGYPDENPAAPDEQIEEKTDAYIPEPLIYRRE